MAEEGAAQKEGEKKVVHTYPLVKVSHPANWRY